MVISHTQGELRWNNVAENCGGVDRPSLQIVINGGNFFCVAYNYMTNSSASLTDSQSDYSVDCSSLNRD